jgi:hypothetical protein
MPASRSGRYTPAERAPTTRLQVMGEISSILGMEHPTLGRPTSSQQLYRLGSTVNKARTKGSGMDSCGTGTSLINSAIHLLGPQNTGRMSSSGMLHRLVLRIDVSEECSASIIRVKRIVQLGTLAATSNRRTLRRNTKCS